MTDHLKRARLLINQGRYELARREISQTLATTPDHASAHGLLAICLSEMENYAEAIQSIHQAISLSPASAYFYYIYSGILHQQGKQDWGIGAILEALRLDPEKPAYYSRLATIQYDQHKYAEALQTAEQGLNLDAEHLGCMNMRLLALVKLRQIDLVETEVEVALADAPENFLFHVIKGWVELEQNHTPSAMQSFREALRLNPQSDWAYKGLVKALKSKNGLYQRILWFDLWRSRLGQTWKAGLKAKILISLACPFYALVFVILDLIRPLFTMLLWIDPYGRFILKPQEIKQCKWLSAIFLSLLPGAILVLITHQMGFLFIPPSMLLIAYCIKEEPSQRLGSDYQKLQTELLVLLGIEMLLLSIAWVIPHFQVQGTLLFMVATLFYMQIQKFAVYFHLAHLSQ